jgi:inositol-phosphate transport system substrate-binding protein
MILLATASLVATGCPPAQEEVVVPPLPEVEVITLRAWTVGPDAVAFYRAENLVLAAERMNKMLEDVGAGLRVEIEADFWTESWASFRKRTILALEGGDPEVIPDILCSSHLDIAPWAEAGWIIPLDEYIERYWACTYGDFFPHLWEATTWDGRKYGVPQDIEVRMVWYRRDHLRALGWTEEEIAALGPGVAAGEILLNDIAEIAVQMQEAGLVEHGIIHRPTAGPDWFQFVVSFGGEYFDPATGKLVLEKAPTLEMMEFIYRITHIHGVTPPGMTGWPWPTIHKAFMEGDAGFFITGGMWHWPGWQVELGISEEYLFENIGWTLIPAGNPAGHPNQFGHPLAYMVTTASRHPELAALLITIASSVDLNTNMSITGGKLAIRRSQVAYERFAEAEFLAAVTELLPYQRFMPSHPKTGLYSTILFETLMAVQTGKWTPEVAMEFMVKRVQAEIGEEIIIRP